jgi:hypothetical protein
MLCLQRWSLGVDQAWQMQAAGLDQLLACMQLLCAAHKYLASWQIVIRIALQVQLCSTCLLW